MKRLLSCVLAAAVIAAPIVASAGEPRRDRGAERRAERQFDRRYERDVRRSPRAVQAAPRGWQAQPAPRDFPGRVTADRFEYRGGYTRPPAPVIRPWARGQYLPQEYWGARVPDPGRYRLRPPPYGYSWVGVGRDVYLMQDTTGLILDSIPGAF